MTVMLRRILVLVGLPAASLTALTALGWAPALLDLADTLLFFFGFGCLFAFAPRIGEAYAATDPLAPRDFVSLGLTDVFVAAVLAAVWSVRARSGHSSSLLDVDVGLRLAFRAFTLRGFMFLLLAQGCVGQTRVPPAQWLRVIAITTAAVAALAIAGFAGQVLARRGVVAEMHDAAPAVPEEVPHAP